MERSASLFYQHPCNVNKEDVAEVAWHSANLQIAAVTKAGTVSIFNDEVFDLWIQFYVVKLHRVISNKKHFKESVKVPHWLGIRFTRYSASDGRMVAR